MSLKYEVIRSSRKVEHLRHGQSHRSNGCPNRLWENGDMFWYEYDALHSRNGPAIIYGSTILYYIRGKRVLKSIL